MRLGLWLTVRSANDVSDCIDASERIDCSEVDAAATADLIGLPSVWLSG